MRLCAVFLLLIVGSLALGSHLDILGGGNHPLTIAVRKTHVEAVRLLLTEGADVS